MTIKTKGQLIVNSGKMLSDEQLAQLEATIDILYKSGDHPDQKTILNSYTTDPLKIPILQKILENPNPSDNMTHFALTSLRSLFEIIYIQWNPDIYFSFQDWCLHLLFNKADLLNAMNLEAFCKLYGVLFSCGIRIIPDFQFVSDTIQFFFDSSNITHVRIGLNLCTNMIYSLDKIKDHIFNRQQAIKEKTILTCYIIGSSVFINRQFFDDQNVIRDAIVLLIACLSYDEDIIKDTSMIFLPRTEQWNDQLSNTNYLLTTISNFYFDNDFSEELRKPILDFIFYLTSIRLDYSIRIEYTNILTNIIIKILQMNPLVNDAENIGRINCIISKINFSIISKDISLISSFDEFISTVFFYTNQYFQLDFFISKINEFSVLLNFWSNICSKIPQKVEELTVISQNLYNILIEVASNGLNLCSQFSLPFISYISSFVYKIGLNNDRNFFKQIFTNHEFFQNELYGCYDAYKRGNESCAPLLSALELKVTQSALIVSSPIICKMTIPDDFLRGFSMLYLINFFRESCEKVTKKPREMNPNSGCFECLFLENVVTFLITKIERGSKYLEKSYTSFVILNSSIKLIEEMHPFFLNRLLFIVKNYPTDHPIVETIFSSILSFYSLNLNDVTIVYLCSTFLYGFLYKSNKENNFQIRQWPIKARIKFHRIFSTLMSNSMTFLADFNERKIDFISYLNDLKNRIENLEKCPNKDMQANLYLNDLYGLFRDIQNSEAYSILNDIFYPTIFIFKNFKVMHHLILKFLAEFTENRHNRILSKKREKTKLKDQQKKNLNDLLIFKECGFYLIQFFENFSNSPENSFSDLKYAYRLLTNIFESYSSVIGALKFYENKFYEDLLAGFIKNIDYVVSFADLQNSKLTLIILQFLAVFGIKKLLFLDVFRKSGDFFNSILILVYKTVLDINMKPISIESFNSMKSFLAVSFNLMNSVVCFFIEESDANSSLILQNSDNKRNLLFILDNFLDVLVKYPSLANGDAGSFFLNALVLCPEMVEKVRDSVLIMLQNTVNGVNNEAISVYKYVIHCLPEKEAEIPPDDE